MMFLEASRAEDSQAEGKKAEKSKRMWLEKIDTHPEMKGWLDTYRVPDIKNMPLSAIFENGLFQSFQVHGIRILLEQEIPRPEVEPKEWTITNFTHFARPGDIVVIQIAGPLPHN
jgi:hypothetical protein